MRAAAFLSIFTFFFFSFLFLPVEKAYASASLYFSPGGGNKYVGDRFNVFIYVGSPQATNSYEVRISSSNLDILGISTGGTICKLFPFDPSYTSTSANFQCGLPTPGYTGVNGYIGSIAVRAKSEGTGKLSIQSGSKVLANDGKGTNILTSLGTATYNISPPPTAAPGVSSSTHPDQEKWYKNSSPTFNWSGNGSAFSYVFDQSPDTSPDQGSEGPQTSKTFEGTKEGVWYFHVRVEGKGGWSSPSHYKVQIDTSPPDSLNIEVSPKKDADKPPLVSFSASDAHSGIDHYQIRIDGGEWKRTENPYQIERISSGTHKVEVKAVDKAGNEKTVSADFTVKEVKAPSITFPKNGSLLPYRNEYLIQGTAEKGASVDIYLDGKKIASVKADKDGDFEYLYKGLLSEGKHEVYATSVTDKNIESRPSEKVSFTIDPKAYEFAGQTIAGSLLFISMLLIFLLLIIFIFFIMIVRSRKFRKSLLAAFQSLEKEAVEDIETSSSKKETEKKVKEDIEETEEKLVGQKSTDR